MDNQSNFIVIGRFGRPHGIKGFVTVYSFTEPRDNIVGYSNWHVCHRDEWRQINIVSAQIHSKSIVVQIEGYPDRESVAELTNAEIAVDRSQLDQLGPGEYYWHELIGMAVVGQSGHDFGIVEELMPTGSNDVLVVKGQKKHLIPFLTDQFILEVDKNQRIITVDWDVDF